MNISFDTVKLSHRGQNGASQLVDAISLRNYSEKRNIHNKANYPVYYPSKLCLT